jgi:hypothetical protein
VNSLQSTLTLSSFPSEQVTFNTCSSLNLPPSRACNPLVIELDTGLAGDRWAHPASYDSGFELNQLLLDRLKVLTAVLQQVEELQCSDSEFELNGLFLTRPEVPAAALHEVRELRRNAANAPGGMQ